MTIKWVKNEQGESTSEDCVWHIRFNTFFKSWHVLICGHALATPFANFDDAVDAAEQLDRKLRLPKDPDILDVMNQRDELFVSLERLRDMVSRWF